MALDLKNPGGKEYAVAGGIALGAALLYFWWKKRQGGTPASSTSAGTDTSNQQAPGTPTGLNTTTFVSWLQDWQNSPGRPVIGKPIPGPKPKPKKKPKVPADKDA